MYKRQPLAFADAYASSVVAQEGYDNSSLVAIDGLLETSWQEGVDGNGEGEYLELYLNGEQPVKYLILNLGNWRSNDWFYDNNRPRSLTIQVGEYTATYEFPDGQIERCVEETGFMVRTQRLFSLARVWQRRKKRRKMSGRRALLTL